MDQACLIFNINKILGATMKNLLKITSINEILYHNLNKKQFKKNKLEDEIANDISGFFLITVKQNFPLYYSSKLSDLKHKIKPFGLTVNKVFDNVYQVKFVIRKNITHDDFIKEIEKYKSLVNDTINIYYNKYTSTHILTTESSYTIDNKPLLNVRVVPEVSFSEIFYFYDNVKVKFKNHEIPISNTLEKLENITKPTVSRNNGGNRKYKMRIKLEQARLFSDFSNSIFDIKLEHTILDYVFVSEHVHQYGLAWQNPWTYNTKSYSYKNAKKVTDNDGSKKIKNINIMSNSIEEVHKLYRKIMFLGGVGKVEMYLNLNICPENEYGIIYDTNIIFPEEKDHTNNMVDKIEEKQ